MAHLPSPQRFIGALVGEEMRRDLTPPQEQIGMNNIAIKEAVSSASKPKPAILATGLFGRKSNVRNTEPSALGRLRQLAGDTKTW